MEIIVPSSLELRATQTSPTYVHAAWASGQAYAAGAVRRSNHTGDWIDYWAAVSHISSADNAPGTLVTQSGWDYSTKYRVYRTTQTSYWSAIGAAATETGTTWHTNVKTTLHPAWGSGAIVEGAVRHDPASRRDYRALIAMTAGENTLRPSEAQLSSNEQVRARWLDLGHANAWAMLDERINSRSTGFDASGQTLDEIQFSVLARTSTQVDRLAFAGFVNVDAVVVEVYAAGELVQTVGQSLVPERLSPVERMRTCVLPIRPISAEVEVRLDVTLVRAAWNRVGALTAWNPSPWAVDWASGAEKYVGDATLRISHPASPEAPTRLDCAYAHAWFSALNVATPFRVSGYWGGAGAYPALRVQCVSAGGVVVVDQPLLWSGIARTTGGDAVIPDLDASIPPGGTELAGYRRFEVVVMAPPETIAVFAEFGAIPSGTAPPAGRAIVLTKLYAGLSFPSHETLIASLGVIVAGEHQELGGTEWGVETSILPFSTKERDPTFGVTRFVQRGSARQLRATCFIDTDVASGDDVQQRLAAVEGRPIFFDFNNGGAPYDRLRVFGFFENLRIAIAAHSFESLSLDVQGLVE
jgi:hypothetical protein